MRALKIFCLVFILTAAVFGQQNNYLHYEKSLSTPFIIQRIDNPAQKIKQELNQIINKLNSTSLANENYLIDSLIAESVNGGRLKFLFEYDSDDKLIEWTMFYNENGNWQITQKDEYFYDTYFNRIREIYFDWYNAVWDSSLQILYEYNLDNNLISTTLQSYVSSNWENESRTTYTYDQSGNEITLLLESWQNNQWTNSGRGYSYYSQVNRRDSLLFQKWDGNSWQNYSRTSFYYDSLTTFLNLAIAQLWTGNQFQDYLMIKIMNDEFGNQVQQLEQIWNGTAWVNDIKKDYTYIWNYFESCNAELWNGTNWEPGDTPIFVNSPDGFKIAIVSQRINIYYIIVNVESSNSNTPEDFSLTQNYPNPFNPSTVISYRLPVNSNVKLKVYDVLGNEVATLVNEEKPTGEYEVEFDATGLPSGIYFYQLEAGNFIQTQKMLLLK
jgi:hypothetical protein